MAAESFRTEYRTLSATLSPAPGVNRLYRAGRGRHGATTRVYKVAPAVQWEQDAMLLLRAAGFQPLPAGCYWIALHVGHFTTRQDVDAPLKLLIDTVAAALDVDDACVGALAVTKIPVRPAERRLELRVLIRPVADRAQWAALSRDLTAELCPHSR